MTSRPEMLVFGCLPEDLAVLRDASGPQGPVLRIVDHLVDLAHLAATRWPAAVFLGVGRESIANLEIIKALRAAHGHIPILVIGEDDSLDLERSARQHRVFYYLVHPVDPTEVEAVIRDALRQTRP